MSVTFPGNFLYVSKGRNLASDSTPHLYKQSLSLTKLDANHLAWLFPLLSIQDEFVVLAREICCELPKSWSTSPECLTCKDSFNVIDIQPSIWQMPTHFVMSMNRKNVFTFTKSFLSWHFMLIYNHYDRFLNGDHGDLLHHQIDCWQVEVSCACNGSGKNTKKPCQCIYSRCCICPEHVTIILSLI